MCIRDSSVSEFIKNEHPQIIATILVHLESDQAAEIIGHFPERLRQDVMLRIATLDGVKPIALRELNEVMTKLLTGNENIKKQSMGGIKVAADIMNFMGGESEASPVSYTHLDVYKRQGQEYQALVTAKASDGCLLYTSRCV